jgi:hypothetical protein
MKTYNRRDLSMNDDFVCPVTFQKAQNGRYKCVLLPDDVEATKELQAFIRENEGLYGLLKIKVEFDKKMFDKG